MKQELPEADNLGNAETIKFDGRPARREPWVACPAAGFPPMERPGDSIGRYTLLEELGRGGFGVVWLAEQTEPIHREVALKVIKPGMDSREIIARFEAERQALALMVHPNIAAVLDAGTTSNGRPFFAMELVKGTPLTEYCNEHQFDIRQRLELFIPVCQAVQHAHQKAILHRDLKPANILVTEVDGKPVPKVIDFGIAKALHATNEPTLEAVLPRTMEGMFVGTPQYMSPEQAGSMPDVDTRSDIYTLGVILYELLVGETPISHEQMRTVALDEVLRVIRESEARRPSSRFMPATEVAKTTAAMRHSDPKRISHLLRGDLDWVLLKALEKDRSRRYDTANALAQDLRRHLNDEPVSAGPPSARYRLKKLIRRKKGLFMAASTVLLCLLAGITTTGISLLREKKAVSRLELQQAEDRLARHDVSVGLAYLAHVLRRNPGDVLTANRLLSALTHRSHFLPLLEPLHFERLISHVEFSPDGHRILVTEGRNAWFLDADNGTRMLGPINFGGDTDVIDASFSPDGRRFVLTGLDSQVFDSETGTALTSVLVHPGRKLGDLWRMESTFSPDGNAVATISADKQVVVWNIATSQPLCPPLKPGDWISAIAFSPDGATLASATSSGRITLWDLATGERVADQGVWRKMDYPFKLIFTRDGKRLLTATAMGGYRWLEAPSLNFTGNAVTQSVQFSAIELSVDDKTVITSSADGAIRRWEADTGKSTGITQEHDAFVRMKQCRDGGRILASTNDSRLWLWDHKSSLPLIAPRTLDATVISGDLTADGLRIVTGTANGTVRVWQARVGASRPLVFGSASNRFCVSAMNPQGTIVVTGEGDKITRWNAETGQALGSPLVHPGELATFVFSPDGTRFVSGVRGDSTKGARVWDTQTGAPVAGPFPASGYVDIAFFSAEGNYVGVVGRSVSGRVWNVKTGKPVTGELGTNTLDGVFGHDSRWFALAMDTKAQVWDLTNGAVEVGAASHKGRVSSLTRHPKEDLFATTSEDGTARVWSFSSVQPQSQPLGSASKVFNSAFSPDGSLLATSSLDFTARLWDWRSGSLVTEPLHHRAAVLSAEFSPDGTRIATASADEKLRIWDCQTGRPLTDPLSVPGRVHGVQWSADGQSVFARCADGQSALWQVQAATTPAPAWLADWAETVGGQRLDDEGRLHVVAFEDYQRFRKLAASVPTKDVYGETLRWFFDFSADRRIAPGSDVISK